MAAGAPPPDLAPSGRYSFEPEFTGHPPRPISDRLNDGPHARRQRTVAIVLAVMGIASLLISRVPGLEVLARYVLPLAYLQWIGLGCLALAALAYGLLALRVGPWRYVREGMPLAVRVVELIKTPTAIHNGVPAAHAFVAGVVFRHPETGEVRQAQVKSNDFPSSRKDAYDTPFKVGEEVTGVYLPGRLEKTLKLYAFLELSPDVNLRARSTASPGVSPWKIGFLVVAVAAMFVVLFANVYAFGRYHPVQFDYRKAAAPMAAGALLLGGGMLAGIYLEHRAAQRRIRKRALAAALTAGAIETTTPFLGHGLYARVLRVVVPAGSILLGAGTAMCWSFMANAWLDRSPPRPVPATILDMTMTTHALVFREYELEFRLEGFREKSRMLTTPEHLAAFRDVHAVAQVREGRLGWPWVETVIPAPR